MLADLPFQTRYAEARGAAEASRSAARGRAHARRADVMLAMAMALVMMACWETGVVWSVRANLYLDNTHNLVNCAFTPTVFDT